VYNQSSIYAASFLKLPRPVFDGPKKKNLSRKRDTQWVPAKSGGDFYSGNRHFNECNNTRLPPPFLRVKAITLLFGQTDPAVFIMAPPMKSKEFLRRRSVKNDLLTV